MITIQRNRTALTRSSCSAPLARALIDGIITKETSVFDYGCGLGADIRYLRSRRIRADGWDPHHRSKQKIVTADVINLVYVLNVIENIRERDETLVRAFVLARRVLIVAVRTAATLDEAEQFADGVITRRGTFQKVYAQSEFREYLEAVLQRRIHITALGVAYVFKDEEAEARYVANRAFTRRLEYRTDLIQEFKESKLANKYVALANQLGRLPLAEEFPKYRSLVESFGSPKRIERLALVFIDHTAFEGSRDQRREDIVTYLAMLKLKNIKPPGISRLPVSIQSDIKAIWRTYSDALKEGEQFLFGIGKAEVVTKTCRACPVGKLLPSHLYVHRSAEDELPPLLRVLLFAAKEIVGELPYDLVKFAKDGRAVSFLLYRDFDGDPHPSLLRSVKVFLPKAVFDVREYFNSPNPPILHRKETFVLPNYPYFGTFKRLSEQEEALGLLSASDIGYRQLWDNFLLVRGLRIEGHNVVAVTAT